MSTEKLEKKTSNKLRTSEDVYNRLRWNAEQLEINLDDVVIGYTDTKKHASRPSELPFHEWIPIKDGGEIPSHHICYFATENSLLWDKASKVDRLFQSGAGVGKSGVTFRVASCLPKAHWQTVQTLAPKKFRSWTTPILPIANVTLPDTESLCETTLSRWSRRLFGEDEESPFQPLSVTAKLEQRTSETNPENTDIIMSFESDNLTTLRKLIGCQFTPFETTLHDTEIVVASIETSKAGDVLSEMREKFKPFSCNLKVLDFFDEEGEFVAGFSLCDLHLVTRKRRNYLKKALEEPKGPKPKNKEWVHKQKAKKSSEPDLNTTSHGADLGSAAKSHRHSKWSQKQKFKKKPSVRQLRDKKGHSSSVAAFKGNPDVLSAGFVIFRERDVLVIDRGNGYEFAKGRREQGEKITDTAQRELAEESGLSLPETGAEIMEDHAVQTHYKMKDGKFKVVDYVPVELQRGVELIPTCTREKRTKSVEFVPFEWLTDLKNRKEVKIQPRVVLPKLKKLVLRNPGTTASPPLSSSSKPEDCDLIKT